MTTYPGFSRNRGCGTIEEVLRGTPAYAFGPATSKEEGTQGKESKLEMERLLKTLPEERSLALSRPPQMFVAKQPPA